MTAMGAASWSCKSSERSGEEKEFLGESAEEMGEEKRKERIFEGVGAVAKFM